MSKVIYPLFFQWENYYLYRDVKMLFKMFKNKKCLKNKKILNKIKYKYKSKYI